MKTRTSTSALEECGTLEILRHALDGDTDCYMLPLRLEDVPVNATRGGKTVVLAKSGPAAPAALVASLPTDRNPCFTAIGGRLRLAKREAPHRNC